jgi:glycosyltransferase involved in cell wall biosynthesis
MPSAETSSRPRFSVVVPTRDRADTLQHALQTCLVQNFEPYEIVVSDNGTSGATRQLVEQIASDLIKYVHTPRPLAMSDSWEFALQHASGEFVIFIGDDDGLLPSALRDIDRLLSALHAPLLHWQYVYYMWPNVVFADIANRISIPLKRELRDLRSRDVIVGVANSILDPSMLPSVYHGVVHRDLIDELRKKAGRVFGGSAPDIYTGFAFAKLAKTYPSITSPMSIAGLSASSNGSAMVASGGKSAVAEEFSVLNADAGLGPHPKAPALSCLPATVADTYFRARDALFADDPSLRADRKLMAAACMSSMVWETEQEWRAGLQAVRRSLEDKPALQRWLDRTFHQPRTCTAFRSFYIPWGFHSDRLVIDAAAFGVRDVSGAATLADRVLGQKDRDVGLPPVQESLSAYRRIRSATRILLKGR